VLTDAHPHIGSDKLAAVINAVTAKIIECGGEIHFGTVCVDFITDRTQTADSPKGAPRIAGVTAQSLSDNAVTEFRAAAVILAAGHSASAIYELVQKTGEAYCAEKAGNTEKAAGAALPVLEAKAFACGVRVEHPRNIIDSIQFHGAQKSGTLPAAEYRLTAQADGRGVYSFCMCPGGIVVPSASAPGEIVVNGMSPSGRNTQWSNAAIVTEIRPEDFTPAGSADPLAGLRFRAGIEKLAGEQGNGQQAPAQRLIDFLAGKKSDTLPPSSYAPGLVSSRLDAWLPAHITNRLKQAFPEFNRVMQGFICPEALLIAPETRTSTPVRIVRGENFESPALPGLFPCGEVSGYSGGIVSSALDGENAADAVISLFAC
jgi:uncharacterized FAD-dependent dehydrogenase